MRRNPPKRQSNWKFTPRNVPKTLEGVNHKRRKPTANPTERRSGEKPVTKTSSVNERLGLKVVPMRERLGLRVAPTKRILRL